MTLEEIREYINNLYPDSQALLFENPDYASAFVGMEYSEDRAIYDYDLMVKHLMEKDGMSVSEAVEFIDYNTIRACPYYSHSPIILEKIK